MSDNNTNQHQKPSWQENVLSANHWLRLVFMVLFVCILCVSYYVMTLAVVSQFIWTLVTGQSHEQLRTFGNNLSQYVYQILRFITYNTENKPFPFADWPETSENTEEG